MKVQVRAAREDTCFEWLGTQYTVGFYDGVICGQHPSTSVMIEVGDELEFLQLIKSLNKQCGDVIVHSKHSKHSKHSSSIDASLMIYNGYLE